LRTQTNKDSGNMIKTYFIMRLDSEYMYIHDSYSDFLIGMGN